MDKVLVDTGQEDMLEALLVLGTDRRDTDHWDIDHRGTVHWDTVLASHVLVAVDMSLRVDEFQLYGDLCHCDVRVCDPTNTQTLYFYLRINLTFCRFKST